MTGTNTILEQLQASDFNHKQARAISKHLNELHKHTIDKKYLDLHIDKQFSKLMAQVADNKNELLQWFIKMFIGQTIAIIGTVLILVEWGMRIKT